MTLLRRLPRRRRRRPRRPRHLCRNLRHRLDHLSPRRHLLQRWQPERQRPRQLARPTATAAGVELATVAAASVVMMGAAAVAIEAFK